MSATLPVARVLQGRALDGARRLCTGMKQAAGASRAPGAPSGALGDEPVPPAPPIANKGKDGSELDEADESMEEQVEMWNKDAPVGPEWGGPRGYEPTKHGDWSRNGRCTDF